MTIDRWFWAVFVDTKANVGYKFEVRKTPQKLSVKTINARPAPEKNAKREKFD